MAEETGQKSTVYKGRIPIYTDYEEVTDENVMTILNESLPIFGINATQIRYLWNYYKGEQPILQREKEVRPEINNKIVENHAQEIVAFKLGYQLGEPLQYTCRTYEGESDDDAKPKRLKDINELNTLMFAEDKESCDRDLFEWMCVGGVGYRMVESDSPEDIEEGGAPFEIYTLDPRNTFIIRSSAYHKKPVMAVWVGRNVDTKADIYNVYTETTYYRIENGEITDKQRHAYNGIPIIEYRLNNALMGVFEPVLPLLDAINAVESNRLDGIEQTVQALMKFINCDIDEETFLNMLKLGAIKITSMEGVQGDVDVIRNDLDQTSTQVTKEDLYQAIVNICGMPNRNGQGGSTSDTGAAVLLRDGWTLAESHAKSYELQFKRSERDFLRVVLGICELSSSTDIDLRIRDIELAFNRRNYENNLVKSQVLTTMLAESKVHPQLAFQYCGLFTDPDAAYMQSKEWWEKHQEEMSQMGLNTVGTQAFVPGQDQPDNSDNAGDRASNNSSHASNGKENPAEPTA